MTDKKKIEKLFARYRGSGSGEDLAALFDATAEPLFAMAMHLVRDAGVAEDVLQETYLGLIEGLDRHDATRGGWPYLTGILQRKTLMRFRQDGRKPDPARLEASAAATPEELVERTELTDTLRAALAKLPETYRAVIDPLLSDGLKPAEIARKLGASPGAVRTRLHRGIALLRGALPTGATLPVALLILEGQGLAAVRARVLTQATATSAGAATVSGTTMSLGAKLAAGAAVVVTAITVFVAADSLTNTPVELDGVDTAGLGPTTNVRGIAARRRDEADRGESGNRGEATGTAGDPGGAGTIVESTDTASASAEIRSGEFVITEGQGYSFTQDALVAPENSDLTCTDDDELEAAGRLIPIRLPLQFRDGRDSSPECYLRSIAGVAVPRPVFSDRVRLREGRSRSFVFVVRTRAGGWAACAVVDDDRRRRDRRKKVRLTVRYVHNPVAPEFGPVPDVPHGNLVHDLSAFSEDPLRDRIDEEFASVSGRIAKQLADVDRRATVIAQRLEAGARVTGLLSRIHASRPFDELPWWYSRRDDGHAYRAATFSFGHGIRDDDDLSRTRNRWDAIFDNGRGDFLDVSLASNDACLAWDLGEVAFHDAGTSVLPEGRGKADVAVREGHSYAVRIVGETGNRWYRVRVMELRSRENVIFRWEPLTGSEALNDAVADRDNVMGAPRVTFRMRAGAGGGNPNRLFLDGSKNGYLDRIERLDTARIRELPVDSHEDAVGWLEGGGSVPLDRTWVVTRIRYIASTAGDSNGNGELRIVVGGKAIVEVEEKAEATEGLWEGRLEIRPGRERGCYVEIANSTTCEVEFEGHFE